MGCGSSIDAANKQAQQNHFAAGNHVPKLGEKSLKLDRILSKQEDVRSIYTFDKVLGKGNFGVVHLVYNKKTGEALACKSISKRKLLNMDDVEDVRREVQIMNHLAGHPNVTNLRGTFEDKTFIHLLMDVCTGGELFDRIAERGHFSEKAAAEAVRTIVSVVHHCHQMNVIHRDLKPENFLLSSKEPKAILKATDFGLSRFFKNGERMTEIVGSPFYVAPEVLKRNYGKEADIWSCGVILYILLCGWPPFHGDSTQAIFKNILASPLDLKSDPWPKIGDAAKDVVRKMLTRDPKRRLTAEQVMDHPWMRVNGLASDSAYLPEVLLRMRLFSKMNQLKKEALKVMARALPSNEIMGIREMFEEIDEDGSGCITVDELREGLKRKGADLALQEVQKIVDSIDINGNSKIDYEEFLAATIHLNKLNREDNMIAAFKYFDADDSGFITHQELIDAMQKIGETEVDIQAILKDADNNGDGKIDYEEFCEMMRNNDFDALRTATSALRTQIVVQPKMTQSFSAKIAAPFRDHSPSHSFKKETGPMPLPQPGGTSSSRFKSPRGANIGLTPSTTTSPRITEPGTVPPTISTAHAHARTHFADEPLTPRSAETAAGLHAAAAALSAAAATAAADDEAAAAREAVSWAEKGASAGDGAAAADVTPAAAQEAAAAPAPAPAPEPAPVSAPTSARLPPVTGSSLPLLSPRSAPHSWAPPGSTPEASSAAVALSLSTALSNASAQ